MSSICDEYEGGTSAHILSKKYSLSTFVIDRILREHGITPRSRSEAAALRTVSHPHTCGVRGTYILFHSKKSNSWLPCVSTFEYIRMMQLEEDDNVAYFERNVDQIPYKLDGKTHHYTPDINVRFINNTWLVEEIKPAGLRNSRSVLAKESAALEFYEITGKTYSIVTENEIGREFIRNFKWNGISSISVAEKEAIQKKRARERATKWARENRAKFGTPPDVRRKNAEREKARHSNFRANATPDQLAAFRAKAAERARKQRQAKKINQS